MSAGEVTRRSEQRQRDRPRRSTEAEHREGIRLMVAGDGLPPGAELREVAGDGPVMFGHFTPYDRWAEIDSFFEGNFMERTVKGAFKRTIADQRDAMRVLFQHGKDPQIGMKPLGPISVLREEDGGPYYEVPLLEAGYVRDTLLPGLRAGLYGASYKFRVMREEIVDDPGASDYNPKGLPERTIKEAQVFEFGPVTFPAFQEASAGVRSGTDDYFLSGLANADPEFVRMAAEGADFPALIAHRLGVKSMPKAQARALPSRAGNGNGFRKGAAKIVAEARELDAAEVAERMDSEDVDTLAQMLVLSTEYLEEQDEPADQANVPVMQGVQATLIDLLVYEAQEEEPDDEPEDEGMDEEVSGEPEGVTREGKLDETSDGGRQADAPAGQRESKSADAGDSAAPGPRPTPLLGVKKEPWRL